MEQIKLFIEVTRVKNPIGYLLLFWPCAWGLTIAYDFEKKVDTYLFYLILFFIGSVLMRSAGCIVNDIIDKKFDQKVFRTQNRPIAKNKITVFRGLLYSMLLCFLALIVLLQFNKLTIILALCSMPLAFTYPLMKRYTYWPQLFLGITFNYGLLLGWISISDDMITIPFILYFGAIFWTLGYDTIYGFQDIKDDEIIGLKSTSIKFKNSPKKFLFLCYLIFSISLFIVGIKLNFEKIYFLILLLALFHLFIIQVYKLNINNTFNCLKTFKSNNFLASIIFVSLILGKTI
jgi:4-hydroxybenzoate polyprenyltransferase